MKQQEIFVERIIENRPEFNGAEYDAGKDKRRLTGQILRVFMAMSDGCWRTLGEIAQITGDPEASVSAQLRHLRKKRFGEYVVERRARGDREHGLFEYRVVIGDDAQSAQEAI